MTDVLSREEIRRRVDYAVGFAPAEGAWSAHWDGVMDRSCWRACSRCGPAGVLFGEFTICGEVAEGGLAPAPAIPPSAPRHNQDHCRKGQGDASWRNSVSQVPALNPGSFYAFRAQSLLEGEGDGGPLALTAQESGVTADELGVDYGREAQLKYCKGNVLIDESHIF